MGFCYNSSHILQVGNFSGTKAVLVLIWWQWPFGPLISLSNQSNQIGEFLLVITDDQGSENRRLWVWLRRNRALFASIWRALLQWSERPERDGDTFFFQNCHICFILLGTFVGYCSNYKQWFFFLISPTSYGKTQRAFRFCKSRWVNISNREWNHAAVCGFSHCFCRKRVSKKASNWAETSRILMKISKAPLWKNKKTQWQKIELVAKQMCVCRWQLSSEVRVSRTGQIWIRKTRDFFPRLVLHRNSHWNTRKMTSLQSSFELRWHSYWYFYH